MFIKPQFSKETSFVHKEFYNNLLIAEILEMHLTFRGNVYKNVYSSIVMNNLMNKMLAV